VDIFHSRGKRLYGFCPLAKPADLGSIWFALEENVIPPSYIYIEMNDRQTNTKYKSNLADTVLYPRGNGLTKRINGHDMGDVCRGLVSFAAKLFFVAQTVSL